jgi:tetratricopeptide (TPR) repeat protein
LVNPKRYAEAEAWADRFIKQQPRDPNSHLLKGVILENTNRCPSAIAHFERAIPLSGRDFHPALHRHLGSCRYLMKEFAAAYAHFQKGVNVYLQDEASETLYQYAYSAVIVGDVPRASLLLRALLYQTPDAETRLRERAQGLLAQIEADSSLAGTFLDRLVRPLP